MSKAERERGRWLPLKVFYVEHPEDKGVLGTVDDTRHTCRLDGCRSQADHKKRNREQAEHDPRVREAVARAQAIRQIHRELALLRVLDLDIEEDG